MRTLRTRLTAGAAALLLTTLGLAACGSDDGDTERDGDTAAEQTDDSDADDTGDDGEADGEADDSGDVPAPSGDDQADAEAFLQRTIAAQFEAGSWRSVGVTEGGGMESTTESEISIDSDSSEIMASTTVTAAESVQQTLIIGDTIYMQTPEVGDQWLRIDGSDPELDEMGDILDSIDPEAQADGLENAVISFTTAPGETLDGVETTIVTMVLETGEYLGEDAPEIFGDSVTLITYVGPDDLPRRQITEMGDLTVTVDYSDWGVPVNVEAPSEDQIMDLSDLMDQ